MEKTLAYEYEIKLTTTEGCLDAMQIIQKLIANNIYSMRPWKPNPTFNISMASDGNTLVIRTDKEIQR